MSQQTPLPSRASRASGPKASKSPKKKKKLGLVKIIFIFLAAVIVALAAYVAYLYFGSYKPNLKQIAKPEDGKGAIVVPKEERAQVKPISMVLLGLDTREETGSMNTDVMMAAAFNPKTKTATVVTIPRDSDLNVEGYKRHKANGYYAAFYMYGKNTEKLEKDKLTGYARDETRQMLSKFFDVPLDYTAVINFKGFVDVVDALGGVKIVVDKDMRYIDSVDGTNIDLKKGEWELSGEEALGFVRYRKSNSNRGFKPTAESSDFERNERQSQVIGAIVDRLKSFSSVTKVDSLLDAVGNNLRTDIPAAQIENIIATYFGINRSDVRFIALTGTWRSPYVYLDEDKLQEAKLALKEELSEQGRLPSSDTPSSAEAE
ncbi:LCP family protein [Paenibacillaceae bacterium WGS1546]|uniref:LCP family protein n=1 Tax=Cohnella sp. WGS1546 TaxID=3366810 RepID=UPI00372D2AA1